MGRYYVEVTGVPQEILDLCGYCVLYEEDEFKILDHKGETHLVDKLGKAYVYMDKRDDADAIRAFKGRSKIAIPNGDPE
jgi:hypothetical protein